MATETEKLKIKLVQPADMFADESFNAVIKDIDAKVVGVAHLDSPAHWSLWKDSFDYEKGDIVRITNTKSNQYLLCIKGGKSGVIEPTNNVTDSQVTDNYVTWLVKDIANTDSSSGISIFVGETYYLRGQAVLYNEILYRCISDHTAATDFAADKSYWQVVNASIVNWTYSVYYPQDSIVIRKRLLYKCKTGHTSSATNFLDDIDNWILINDFGLVKEYEAQKDYEANQLITVNGIFYRSKNKHTSTDKFEDDIANWELVDSSIKSWNKEELYTKDVIVIYDGLFYRCLNQHISSDDFEKDRTVNWELLGNVPANMSDWVMKKYYYANQAVINNGMMYRCKIAHISDDFTKDIANWELIGGTGRVVFWSPNTVYQQGQLVIYGTTLYRVDIVHTSTDKFEDDLSNWVFVTANIQNWTPEIYYKSGVIVSTNNVLYKCINSHISLDKFEDDRQNWQIFHAPDPFLFEWESKKYYEVNQIVQHSDKLYQCLIANNDDIFDEKKWKIISNNSSGISIWNPETKYVLGDCALYNNTLYRNSIEHTSAKKFEDDAINWELVYANIPKWAADTYFIKGSCVYSGSSIYVAKSSHMSSKFEDDYKKDYWLLLSVTTKIEEWKPNYTYSFQDIVIHEDKLYECIVAHDSKDTFVKDLFYWKELSQTVTDATSYSQVTKLGVKSPEDHTIIVPFTSTFCRPPLEVLKFVANDGSEHIETENSFDNSDADDFIIDGNPAKENMYVEFGNNKDTTVTSDGTMHLLTNINVTRDNEKSEIVKDSDGYEHYINVFVTMNFNTSMKSVIDWKVA